MVIKHHITSQLYYANNPNKVKEHLMYILRQSKQRIEHLLDVIRIVQTTPWNIS